MAVIINGDTGVTTPGISNSEGYTGDGLTIAAGAPSGAVAVDSSGNVGIGTSSPTSFGAGYTTLTLSGSNSGIFQSKNTLGDTRVYANTSGEALVGSWANTALKLYTNSTLQATIDSSGNLKFNSGYGSVATAYGCRAWVNFNGTGTVAIRASGNVSSITDLATGQYQVNFTTAMPDGNYVVNATTSTTARIASLAQQSLMTTTSFKVDCYTYQGNAEDNAAMLVSIFR